MKTLEQLGISPAPWNARKVGREEGFTGFEVYDDNGNYVLFDGDAGFANCNLIAAAPDMCVALRELINSVLNGDPCHNAIQRGKAALAKAAGESEVKE